MFSTISRYAGHFLVFMGLALVASLIRSASGPADGLGGAVSPPERRAATSGTPSALLISSSQRAAPVVIVPTPEPAATPTAEPTPVEVPLAELPPTDRLVIPRIELDTKVVDVGVLPSGEMETAAYAAGRLSDGAQAGEAGNLVLAGHDDILGEVFRRLPELQVGDGFTIYRGDRPFTYRVEVRTIVREDGATLAQRLDNARWLEPTDDPVATLISCYPYRVDTHRIIVRARLEA